MIVAEEDGYTADSDAAQLLLGLGVPSSLYYQAMDQLPSAKKVRVLLAQALFGTPDALLLDEPTNHLDIATIEWLERYLIHEFKGALLLVTHDRYLLDRVVTRTLEIADGAVHTYEGGWGAYLEAKAVRTAIAERAEAYGILEGLEAFGLLKGVSRPSRAGLPTAPFL